MMDPALINTEQLSEHLVELFGVAPITDIVLIQGGYKCQNFRLQCGAEVFFLKQYRYRVSHWIAEIKYAESFFAERGLPVIKPITDQFGRPMFMMGEYWYSLFPFVDAETPKRGAVSDATIRSMGEMLGRVHAAGVQVDRDPFQHLHGWDREAFRMERVELERHARRAGAHVLAPKILETLAKKAAVVERVALRPHDIPLMFDCLLHGDFIYQNVFVDEKGNVSHIYDLEKTCKGPRAYELARSLLINCFDTAWERENLEQGKQFVAAYRSSFPISFEEFYHGMRMYMIGVAHSTWVESRILMGRGESQHHDLFASHALRIEHVSDDPRELCEELYG